MCWYLFQWIWRKKWAGRANKPKNPRQNGFVNVRFAFQIQWMVEWIANWFFTITVERGEREKNDAHIAIEHTENELTWMRTRFKNSSTAANYEQANCTTTNQVKHKTKQKIVCVAHHNSEPADSWRKQFDKYLYYKSNALLASTGFAFCSFDHWTEHTHTHRKKQTLQRLVFPFEACQPTTIVRGPRILHTCARQRSLN